MSASEDGERHWRVAAFDAIPSPPASLAASRGVRALVAAILFLALSADADAARLDCPSWRHSVDIRVGGSSVEPAALAEGDPFRRFVEGVSSFLGVRFPAAAGSGVEADGRLDIVFLHLSLVADRARDEPGAEPAGSTVRLDSPWVRVRQTEGPGCRLRLTFVWDERQLVLDQALLWKAAGAGPSPAAGPPSADLLSRWAEDYARSTIGVRPEARERAQATLEERIPFEFLWLFRHSLQSTRGPFQGFVSDAFQTLADRAEPAYERLAVHLVAEALREPAHPLFHSEIRQLGSSFDIDSLKLQSIR